MEHLNDVFHHVVNGIGEYVSEVSIGGAVSFILSHIGGIAKHVAEAESEVVK